MTYSTSTWIYPDAKGGQVFSGGIVDNTPSQHLANNYSQYGRNFRLDGQSVINRPGYVLFKDIGGTSHPLGIGNYVQNETDENYIIVRSNVSTGSGFAILDEDGNQTDVVTTVNQQPGQDTTIKFGEANATTKNNKIAELLNSSFSTITAGSSISAVKLYKGATNGTFTGTVTISIQTDTAGAPSGTSLATVTVSNADWLALSTGWHTFTFTSPTGALSASTNYWIVLETSTADNTNYATIGALNGNGVTSYRYNVTDGWDAISGPPYPAMSFVIISDTGVSVWNGTGRTHFTNIGDYTYVMDGTDFGRIKDGVYTNNPGSSVPPSFSVFFGGCHWIAGLLLNGYQDKIFKSSNTDFDTFFGTGTDEFSFAEKVTGLVTASQSLFVFTKNTISTTSYGDLQEESGVLKYNFRTIQGTEGAACNASIVSVGANVFYLSSSNKINRIVPGGNVYGFEVVELSDRKYQGISGLTNTLDKDQSDSFAQYYPEQNLIKWHVKSSGSTINDVCIVYDVEKDMFLVDTAKYFYDATYMNGQVYTVSMVDTTVFKDEFGTDDDGGAINFVYWTKAFDEGEFTLKKCYWESRTDTFINPLAVLTQEIFLNNYIDVYGTYTGTLVDTKTIDVDNIDLMAGGIGTEATGTFSVGTEGSSTITMYPATILRTKGNLNCKGYSIAFRYSMAVVGGQVRLNRLGYKMEVLPGLATNLTA